MIKVVRLSALGEEFLGRTLSGEVVDAINELGWLVVYLMMQTEII